MNDDWYVGTLTLAGVTLGAIVGLVIEAIPIAVALGTAIGVANRKLDKQEKKT